MHIAGMVYISALMSILWNAADRTIGSPQISDITMAS